MSDPHEPEGPPENEPDPVEFTGPRDQVGFENIPPQPSQKADDDGGAETRDTDLAELPDLPNPAEDADRMGLLDHLDELRTVLIHSFFAALVATILCWFWSAELLAN